VAPLNEENVGLGLPLKAIHNYINRSVWCSPIALLLSVILGLKDLSF